MAYTLTQKPSGSARFEAPYVYNMAYTRLPYVVSGSTNSSQPQFRYVMDVYLSGSGELVNRATQPVNPAGVAVFDPSRTFQSNIDYKNDWYTTGEEKYVTGTFRFNLEFGEQYGTSPSSSVTTTTGIVTSSIITLPGTVDPNNGVSYNFDWQLYNSTGSSLVYSYIPKEWMTNFPYYQTNNPPVVIPAYSDNMSLPYQWNWTSKNSYMTVYTQNGGDPTIRYYDKDDTYLGKDDFTTDGTDIWVLGIGPKNLDDWQETRQPHLPLTWNSVKDSVAYISIVASSNPPYTVGIYRPSGSAHPNQPPSNCDTVLTLASGSTNVTVDNGVNFAFINNLGLYDYYYTTNPVRKITDLERESVDLPQLDYSNASAPYDVNERGQKDYYTDRKDRFIVTTDYITKEVANWLEELFESPRVFVQETGQTYVGDSYVFVSNNTPDVYTGFVPVTVTNKVIQTNNSTSRNKLFQYTIEFEFSNRRAAWIAGPLGQYANVKGKTY